MSSKTDKAPSVPVGIRLHELAKEMGLTSKALVEKATELGIKNVKSHASILTPGQADRMRAKFGAASKKLKAEHETRIVTQGKENVGSSTATVSRSTGRITEETYDEPEESAPPIAAAATDSTLRELEPVAEPASSVPQVIGITAPVEEVPATEPVSASPASHVGQASQAGLDKAPVAGSDGAPPEAPSPTATSEPVVQVVAAPPAAPEAPVAVKQDEVMRYGVVTPAPPPPPPAPVAVKPVAKPTVPPPAPPVAKVHPIPVPVSTPAPAVQPPKPVRRILAGPEVVPPIQRGTRVDPRFGVVTPAPPPEPEKPPVVAAAAAKPPVRGAKPVQVESKSIDDFKPQVSYPVLPESFKDDDEKGKSARSGGSSSSGPGSVRRGPGRATPGFKGFSSGPRRGVALLRDDGDRFRGARRPKQRQAPKPTIKREGPAEVTSPVTIKALCEALGIKASDLIRKFFEQGKMVKINDILLDSDAELYALEFDPLKHGINIKKARDVEEELLKRSEVADKPEDVRPRAPVVTIMGHVDHGKTSLLDYIRNAKVAAGEAGGITQHIGAYKVHHTKGAVAFLDTPGHKAFTEMRARGANVTDIVILVVAATDGVMPQTEEAISHARQAGKKIVVALNKIDLPDANPDKVKGQLASKELFVEGYGGDVGVVEVSAKTGRGVDELLDRILLEAEILQLTANPNKPAVGTVVEAHKDQGRGIVCTLLIQEGTLRQGDVIICGHAYGSVRQIFSDTGKQLKEAGTSTPVLVTGLNDVPLSGERFHVLDSIKEAAEIAQQRAMRMRQEGLVKRTHVTLETLSDMLALGAVASLKLVLKVDVQGSLAPLRNAISELSRPDARIDILHDGVGAINETDVLLADASDAIVIGFSVTADPGARRLAEERSVDIRIYNIIYEVVDDVRKALEGMLKPIEREVIHGHATIRQIFKISKMGTIAGCFVNDGIIQRNSSIRLVRDGKPVWSGKLASLKRVKDDVKEVRSGFECGIKLESYDDLKQGDTIEAYATEQVKQTLAAQA